jgi:GNAT superfamily N-acetyltransferase
LGLTGESATSVIAVLRMPAPPVGGEARNGGRSELARLSRLAVETVREDGHAVLARSTLATAGVRRLVVYRRKAVETTEGGFTVPGVVTRLLSDQDIEAYLELRPDSSPAEVTRRLQAGQQCISAWRESRLVSSRWVAHERAEMPYLRASFRLRPGVVYIHDAFTHPGERRHGVGTMVTNSLTLQAASDGATSVIYAVLPENRGGAALVRGRAERIGVLGSISLRRRLIVVSRLPSGYLWDPVPHASRG